MIYIKLYNNTGEEHIIQDIWNLDIDGMSVCGVDFVTQEARTAKFTYLTDTWTETNITGYMAQFRVYKNYLFLCGEIFKDSQMLFRGWLPAGNWSQTDLGSGIKEITLTLVDAIKVIKDMGEGQSISISQGTSYNCLNSITNALQNIITSNLSWWGNLKAPQVVNEYSHANWSVLWVQALEMFNRRDYDFADSIMNNGDFANQYRQQILRIDQGIMGIYLSYVDYISYDKNVNDYHPSHHQLFKYGVWKLDGIYLITTREPIEESRVDTDLFQWAGNHLVNINNQTFSQWVLTLPTLLGSWGSPTGNSGVNTITQYPYAWSVANGKLTFTGTINLSRIIVNEDKEMELLDWLYTNLQLLNAYLFDNGTRLAVQNKLRLSDTALEYLNSEIIGNIELKYNIYKGSKLSRDLSYVQSGEALEKAINTYLNGILSGDAKLLMELEVDGLQNLINKRLMLKPYLTYVIKNKHNYEQESTKITGLGKRLI